MSTPPLPITGFEDVRTEPPDFSEIPGHVQHWVPGIEPQTKLMARLPEKFRGVTPEPPVKRGPIRAERVDLVPFPEPVPSHALTKIRKPLDFTAIPSHVEHRPPSPDVAAAQKAEAITAVPKPSVWERLHDVAAEAIPSLATKTVYDPTYGRMQLIDPEAALTTAERERHPIVTGTLEAAGSLTSPENVALIAGTAGFGGLPGAAGRILPRVVSGVFSATMIKGAYDVIPEVREAAERGDEAEVKRLLTHLVLDTGMAYLAGKHALKGAEVRAAVQEKAEAPLPVRTALEMERGAEGIFEAKKLDFSAIPEHVEHAPPVAAQELSIPLQREPKPDFSAIQGHAEQAPASVYHGARLDAAESILKEGLRPGRETGKSMWDIVFASEDKAEAMSYAQSRARRLTDEAENIQEAQKYSTVVVIKPGEIAESVRKGSYKDFPKTIPPEEIEKIEIYRTSDMEGRDPKPVATLKGKGYIESRTESKSNLDEPTAAKARELGATFNGIQEGGAGHPGLALFTDGKTKTTVGVRLDELTPAKLEEHVAAARERMKLPGQREQKLESEGRADLLAAHDAIKDAPIREGDYARLYDWQRPKLEDLYARTQATLGTEKVESTLLTKARTNLDAAERHFADYENGRGEEFLNRAIDEHEKALMHLHAAIDKPGLAAKIMKAEEPALAVEKVPRGQMPAKIAETLRDPKFKELAAKLGVTRAVVTELINARGLSVSKEWFEHSRDKLFEGDEERTVKAINDMLARDAPEVPVKLRQKVINDIKRGTGDTVLLSPEAEKRTVLHELLHSFVGFPGRAGDVVPEAGLKELAKIAIPEHAKHSSVVALWSKWAKQPHEFLTDTLTQYFLGKLPEGSRLRDLAEAALRNADDPYIRKLIGATFVLALMLRSAPEAEAKSEGISTPRAGQASVAPRASDALSKAEGISAASPGWRGYLGRAEDVLGGIVHQLGPHGLERPEEGRTPKIDWARKPGPTAPRANEVLSGGPMNVAPTPENVERWVQKYARENRLDPRFVRAIIKTESTGRHEAVSRKGAAGLMQLMPKTAAEVGVNPRVPEDNVRGGARYISKMLRRFDGNVELALAAYNAGPTRVARLAAEHGDAWRDHVPHETNNYIDRVMRRAGR